MGCIDGRSGPEVQRQVMKDRLDLTTRLLCETVGKLEKAAADGVEAGKALRDQIMTFELEEWWQQHLKEDMEREGREIRGQIIKIEAKVVEALRVGDQEAVDGFMSEIDELKETLQEISDNL